MLAGLVALVTVAGMLAGCARRAPSSDVSPLTGQPGAGGPVLAVKVDNARAARPWSGLEAADVVYVEPVEGGATRLLAVFASRRPASVGPVRSFRESDLGILAAYGRPGLVYSGAAPELSSVVAGAPVVGLSPATVPDAFRRDASRRPPDNLYADPEALAAAAGDADGPRDVGFDFGPAPSGGTATTSEEIAVGSTTVGLGWEPASARWQLSMDGRPAVARDGTRLVAATVLVQTVETVASGVRDVGGTVSPRVETVGEGAAEVLRDGRTFPARWSRVSPGSGTTVTGDDGQRVAFAPGPVWVLLVPQS